MIVTTEAIVISTRKFGDTSRTAILYTKDFGKLNIISKSARKSAGKHGSSLEPMSCCSATIYKKKPNSLHLLSKSEILFPCRHIIDSVEHLSCALMILDTLSQTQNEEFPSIEIFELLKECLLELNRKSENPFSILIYFLLNLIRYSGYSLETESLSSFPNIEKSNIAFSYEENRFIQNYKTIIHNAFIFTNSTLNILTSLSECYFEDVTTISIKNKNKTELKNFFAGYLSFYFEKKIRLSAFDLSDILSENL